jgi:hypothetical protein
LRIASINRVPRRWTQNYDWGPSVEVSCFPQQSLIDDHWHCRRGSQILLRLKHNYSLNANAGPNSSMRYKGGSSDFGCVLEFLNVMIYIFTSLRLSNTKRRRLNCKPLEGLQLVRMENHTSFTENWHRLGSRLARSSRSTYSVTRTLACLMMPCQPWNRL